MRVAELLLRGMGGEPVDLARTIVSHGVAELPPNRVELEARTLETTLPVPRGARTVQISASGGKVRIDAAAGKIGVQSRNALAKTVAHMFRLDENLLSELNAAQQPARLGDELRGLPASGLLI